MKRLNLHLLLAAAVACIGVTVVSDAKAQAFTYVQLFCDGAGFSEHVVIGGPSTKTCSDSGPYIYGEPVGTFTSAAGGNSGFGGGDLAAAVTYTHLQPTGVSVGPQASATIGGFDRLTGLDPMLAITIVWSVNRVFGSGADPGIAAVPTFNFVTSLGNGVCERNTTGLCPVTTTGTDFADFAWVATSQAAVSGSGDTGSGFAFDPGTFGIHSVMFRDSAGNLVSSSFQSASGFDYLAVVNPVPEPETWALMLAGLSGLTFVSWRRRRAR